MQNATVGFFCYMHYHFIEYSGCVAMNNNFAYIILWILVVPFVSHQISLSQEAASRRKWSIWKMMSPKRKGLMSQRRRLPLTAATAGWWSWPVFSATWSQMGPVGLLEYWLSHWPQSSKPGLPFWYRIRTNLFISSLPALKRFKKKSLGRLLMSKNLLFI